MKSSVPILLCASMALAGCSTLPKSGPTGPEVQKSALTDPNLALSVVEVDGASALPMPTAASIPDSLVDMPPPPTDMVGPGDVLGITIYEAGVTLFAAGGSDQSAGAGASPGVRAQTLPEMRVDDAGYITVPYAGKLQVAGRTVGDIEGQIRRALRGVSQSPQVIVTRREVIANSVIVGGEVGRPGRLVLQTNRETLADIIALAGGYKGRSSELRVQLTRAGGTSQMRLGALLDGKQREVRAYPGDRLTLISDPFSFSVLGAAGRMDQIPFTTEKVTLAQAIALAGGANAQTGDPAAIFLFRYVTADDGSRKPVVYHINMMKTGAYFLAQNFAMQNGDILYFGNARANQPSKLIQLISQLFSPFLTVTSAVSVIQNSSRN